MCVSLKKKNPLSFPIIWCGTFWSDLSHAQSNYGGRLDLSAGLTTAIPFTSVLWHPAHTDLSLIQMNLMNIYTSK